MRVVAEANDGVQTLELARKVKPSLILMDFDTIQEASLEILASIRKDFPNVKVIVFFSHTSDQLAIRLIRAGADGFVVKSADSADMQSAIETVIGGGVYLSSEFLRSLGTAVLRDGIPDKDGKTLSPRQVEILKDVAKGLSTKAVAYELKISPKTVDVHKRVLMKRLGINSTTDLVKYAIRAGMVAA